MLKESRKREMNGADKGKNRCNYRYDKENSLRRYLGQRRAVAYPKKQVYIIADVPGIAEKMDWEEYQRHTHKPGWDVGGGGGEVGNKIQLLLCKENVGNEKKNRWNNYCVWYADKQLFGKISRIEVEIQKKRRGAQGDGWNERQKKNWQIYTEMLKLASHFVKNPSLLFNISKYVSIVLQNC